ncbi:hypothetical protein M2222_001256 [Bradyrhizobium elkanii]|uniref:hypothetical protein n=1 Tax=Bradyrhizobium elkanii TaxID=29448 RepID=UPI0021694B06|nr:hypothetical protein [Bradyrhizobium elkanii]MCS3449921.1 hypothetical protein [Bradyrhizobium elkanii]MCS3558934.1 hypothetical protein [Bradyrhizobium elkanii]MCW2151218.1 hypothetical protein [Bradyrhizobium elkanii]MCW2374949.1 hypothetical protein [Bradyrhizobium elkanii]
MNDHQAMLAIQEQMDGVEWDSDTLSAIGDIMINAGYRIRDMNDVDLEARTILESRPKAQLDRAWMLAIGSADELGDLITWIDEHPSDEELDEEGIPVTNRARLDTWLQGIAEHQEQDAYPCYVPVPLELVGILNMLIDDWSEVENSHGETFTTMLTSSEG